MEKTAPSRVIRVKKLFRKRRIFRFIATFVILTSLLGGYFAYTIFGAMFRGWDSDAAGSKFRTGEIEIKKDPFAILLIGADGRASNSHDWRPDVLMVAAVNPKSKSIKLVSIPRDTYTKIANTHGFKTKINAAAYWGYQKNINPVQNIRETVENLLHIPIDYYAKANFTGFTNIVNILGGVNVNVEFPFTQQAIGGKMVHFRPGEMHLDGGQTLAYVRMRKQDPAGDHGRNRRQQEVITKLIDKALSFKGIKSFPELIYTIGQNITYSVPVNEIPALSRIYEQSKGHITPVMMKTTPARKNGICYEILDEAERERISHILQQQLEFSPNDVAKTLVAKQQR